MAVKRRSKEVARLPDAPEFIRGCKFWKSMECQKTFAIFLQTCGVCDGCRLHRHESTVSKALAEAQSAAVTIAVTLTHADDDHGEWLDYSTVSRFLKRLRNDGYTVRKLSSGEYGGKNARAHWHLLLFFQWDDPTLEQWRSEQIAMTLAGRLPEGFDDASLDRARRWSSFCPKLRVRPIPDREDFMRMLANPDVLWCPRTGHKSAGNYRQDWKYWPYGKVEAQLVSAPGIGSVEEQNRAVRYVVKYAVKDPWKDGKGTIRRTAFDDLPEHIRQSTDYGPWDLEGTNDRTKWVRGNRYREELEKALLSEFETDDDVPLHRRIKRNRYNMAARGGLGRDYFQALGGWYAAKVAGQEELADRTFKLGPSYRRNHIEAVRRSLQNGRVPVLEHRNQFYMGDTAFRQFALGFNKYLISVGEDESSGPDQLFDTLETQRTRLNDMQSGPLGYELWNKNTGNSKADLKRRKTLEKVWGELPAERLRGLVPARLQRLLEDTSTCEGWQNKRRQRLQNEANGKPKTSTAFGCDRRIIETTERRFFYEKDLKPGDLWWRRELLTIENLIAAFEGNFLPENARAARLEREGRGDQKELSELDIRTVRRMIKNAHNT